MGEKISSFSQPVGTLPRAAQAMGRSGDGPKRECPVSPRVPQLPTTRAVGPLVSRVRPNSNLAAASCGRPHTPGCLPTYRPRRYACPLRRAVPTTTIPAQRRFHLPGGMRAHPPRICTRNGLTPAASASAPGMGSPGMGSPRRICPAHLHRDRAAVAMLKQSVNSSFETPLTHGILHERHIFYSTFSTVTLQHRIAHAESRHSPTSVLGLCAAPQTFILSHSRDAASDCRKTRRRAWPHLRRSARLRSRTTERSCHQHERAFCATDRASQTQLKSLAVCQTTLPLEVATVAVMFTSGAR